MTKLSVNLNKVALLRNQRDVGYPDVIEAGKAVLEAGAHGITVHPRPDERHIKRSDVVALSQFIKDWQNGSIELNIDGYPDSQFLDLVTENHCHQVTLVPDTPDQLTSDHGWNVEKDFDYLKNVVSRLQKQNRRVSIFLDPVPELIKHISHLKAERIELYTGPYAQKTASLKSYIETAKLALQNDIGINAGHDLSLDNLAAFITAIPHCAEVSIGHALISDALTMGWNGTIAAYLTAIEYGHKQTKNYINETD